MGNQNQHSSSSEIDDDFDFIIEIPSIIPHLASLGFYIKPSREIQNNIDIKMKYIREITIEAVSHMGMFPQSDIPLNIDDRKLDLFVDFEYKLSNPLCITSILGSSNVGKTSLLNKLAECQIPTNLMNNNVKVDTGGLCFKIPKKKDKEWLLFIDTGPFDAPVTMQKMKILHHAISKSHSQMKEKKNPTEYENSPLSNSPLFEPSYFQQQMDNTIAMKERSKLLKKISKYHHSTQNFIIDYLQSISNCILYVCNEMTFNIQLEINLIHDMIKQQQQQNNNNINSKILKKNRTDNNKLLIVVHNFQQVETIEEFNQYIQLNCLDCFPGEFMYKQVDLNHQNGSSNNSSSDTQQQQQQQHHHHHHHHHNQQKTEKKELHDPIDSEITNTKTNGNQFNKSTSSSSSSSTSNGLNGLCPVYQSDENLIHVFMAKEKSPAGEMYNKITLHLILQYLHQQYQNQAMKFAGNFKSFLCESMTTSIQKYLTNVKSVEFLQDNEFGFMKLIVLPDVNEIHFELV